MIGANLPHHIQSADDARAYAHAIGMLRAAISGIDDAIGEEMAPHNAAIAELRRQRDAESAPYAKRADELRKVLADWLAGDPDGNLRDGDRIVATLARKVGKVKVDEVALPERYKTMVMVPDMNAINAALARGEKIPGVTVPIDTSLRVLT